MSTSSAKLHKAGNNRTINSISGNKKFANRVCVKRISTAGTSDKTEIFIYQINYEGKIIKTWKSRREISQFFRVNPDKVSDAVKNQIVVGNCLFVMIIDYRSSIDYSKLIKYLKYKEKNNL